MFHATSFALAHVTGTLTGNCGDNPGIACRLAWDLSHSSNAAQLVKIYLAGPASRAGRILFIVVLALVVRTVLGRLIKRVTERAATAKSNTPAIRSPFIDARLRVKRAIMRRIQYSILSPVFLLYSFSASRSKSNWTLGRSTDQSGAIWGRNIS